MECSVSLGESQRFTAGKEVRSDTFGAVYPRPHLVPPRPQMLLPRSGCGLSSTSASANVSACFAQQLNPPLTAPIRAVLKGSSWNLSPAGSLELSEQPRSEIITPTPSDHRPQGEDARLLWLP